MAHSFANALGASLVVLGTGTAVSAFSFGSEPPVLLPRDRDSVFRKEAFTATHYFHFGKDGKYRTISREHMFTAEMDRGTWKQEATGEIELRSSIRLKELKKGPMRIEVRDTEELDALRPLEKDIEKFLATDRSDFWPRERIESAWQYTYTCSLFDSTRTFSAVAVEQGVAKITRKQLVGLLDAWRAYLKDDTKNRFHIFPVRHHKFVLLVLKDYPFCANAETPEKVKEVADLFRPSDAPETPPTMVYALVDSKSVLQEMKTKQPFIFYPQLNRDGEEVLRYK
jgi:hypothetical protein